MPIKNSKHPVRKTLNDLKNQTKTTIKDEHSQPIEEFGAVQAAVFETNIPTQEEAPVNIEATNGQNVWDAVISSQRMEIEDWKSKAIRATADATNLQKQFDIDIAQAKKNGKKSVAKSIMSFLTALNLAFAFVPQSEDEKVNKFVNTLKFSFASLVKELGEISIEVLTPAIGDSFDPIFMSAVNPGTGESGEIKVKQVVSPGLRIDGNLIQPCSVLI